MKLKTCIGFSILLVTVVNAFAGSNSCPDFQLKCPTCKHNEKCVYPDSGGCSGAGVPVCKSTQCHNISCLTLRIPCPEECPFSCRYDGPPCCPFNGKPVCEPVCNTLVACKVTPCPSNCPGHCHYPDADYCCPRSGKAVCNIGTKSLDKRMGGLGYKSGAVPSALWGPRYSLEAKGWDQSSTLEESNGWGYDRNGAYHTCTPGDPYCQFGISLDDGPLYDKQENKQEHEHEHNHDKQEHHQDHYHGDDDYYEGLFIGGLNKVDNHECNTCIKTITDIDISLEFVTTTASSDDIFCAQYIIPCPDDCPYTCIYPMDQPCPFTQEPWCPSIFDPPVSEECDTVFATEGYPFPYFPTYDPYHSVFTSLLNNSGVTSTPTFVTEIATESPISVCPLIFRYCPIECPDSCLRPDVPCPFAAEGYCPGDIPTTTVSEGALITPTAETVVGGELICPLYILACPVCPDDYSCARETVGHCANTNIPYCISTIIPINPTPVFEFYPTPASLVHYYPPPPPLFDFHAQSTPDKCAEAGLVKVSSEKIFYQLQEHRFDCQDCPFLEWDEVCPNTCIYRTEENCCIQSLCLPN